MTILQKYISAPSVQAVDLYIEHVGTAQGPRPVQWGWPAECKLFLSKIDVSL